MHAVALKNQPNIKRIILAAMPRYAKHKAYIHSREKMTLSGTYWDAGSRSTYHAVRLADCFSLGAPQFDPAQFGGPSIAPTIAIPVGVAIVETGVFCGKPATASVTFNPADITLMLS